MARLSPAHHAAWNTFRKSSTQKASETREFTLPIHGEIAGNVELFEQTHWCRLEAHETHDEQLRLGIDCYQGGRKREHLSFEFSVERSFESRLCAGDIRRRLAKGRRR